MANHTIDMLNDQLRTLLEEDRLNEILEEKKGITKLFQRRKLIEQARNRVAALNVIAQGGFGAVYALDNNHVVKVVRICPGGTRVGVELCNLARNDDPEYETIDTALDKKKYMIPNYILELFNGIYLSHKLQPYTDGFSMCYGGLYDKTNRVTYAIQERLIASTDAQTGLVNGFAGMSDADYLFFLLELFLTLGIAQDKYKFVHHDLHYGNLMFRHYATNKQRVYDIIFTDITNGNVEPVQINITSQIQPVIIDYGYSRFENEKSVFGPTASFRHLDKNLYNPYYDMTTILRSFLGLFDPFHAFNQSANQRLYFITLSALSHMFLGAIPHNDLINNPRLFDGSRITSEALNVHRMRNVQEMCNYFATSVLQQLNPLIPGDAVNPHIQSFPLNLAATNINADYNIINGQASNFTMQKQQPNNTVRYYNAQNLNFHINFRVVQAPLGQRLGGIANNFAWQYENYQLSRQNDFGLANIMKWYNFTFDQWGDPANPIMYLDAINISCAVMWQPNAVVTPFRFSTECCRIDTKRFLQQPFIREGITINGAFFNWTSDYKPIGYFKKNQIVLDDTEISYNYLNDFYYVRIDENGVLSISADNVTVSDPLNEPFFDETKNTSIFASGPKLVHNGISNFNNDRIGHYYVNPNTNQRYFKYMGNHGAVPLINNVPMADIIQHRINGVIVPFNAVTNQPINMDLYILAANGGALPAGFNIDNEIAQTMVADVDNLRAGDLVHALNPNPRSVIATTNNGLVLFFTFAGRHDHAVNAAAPALSTGLDFIDLSQILVDPALLAPLNLPAGTVIQDAINVDGGGSASVNIKEENNPNIFTSGVAKTETYPVGNILAYTYK